MLATNEDDTRDTMRRRQDGARFALRAPLVFLVAWIVSGLVPFGLYLR